MANAYINQKYFEEVESTGLIALNLQFNERFQYTSAKCYVFSVRKVLLRARSIELEKVCKM